MLISPVIKQLIDALCCLPGIGPKSAERMTFKLLNDQGRQQAVQLAEALLEANKRIKHCQLCQIHTDTDICSVCTNPKRDTGKICVVQSPLDAKVIEQTGSFRGRYFVLLGPLSPFDGQGPKEIGIHLLLDRLKQEPIEELILATNPTAEGEATAQYIVHHMVKTIKCTRIAHGVPLGGELEYLDGGTLMHALLSRIPIDQN